MVFQVSYETQNGEENESTEELAYAQVARGREFYKIYYKDQTSQLKHKNAAENRLVRDNKAREKEVTRKDFRSYDYKRGTHYNWPQWWSCNCGSL